MDGRVFLASSNFAVNELCGAASSAVSNASGRAATVSLNASSVLTASRTASAPPVASRADAPGPERTYFLRTRMTFARLGVRPSTMISESDAFSSSNIQRLNPSHLA